MSVKRALLRIRRHVGDLKLALKRPNQGLESRFCCWIAKATAHVKGMRFSQTPASLNHKYYRYSVPRSGAATLDSAEKGRVAGTTLQIVRRVDLCCYMVSYSIRFQHTLV